MAKHRKRNRRRTVHASHAHHTKRRRRRNPTRVYVMGRKGNRRTGRRHNPMLFGATVSGKDFGLSILGGLVGVWATKQIASLVPATLVSSPYLSAAVQAIAAYFEGWLASKANPRFGSAVAFGGYMQAGSTLLNQLAPSLPIGLGDFVPARFAEPENPIRRAMFAQAAASAAAAAGPATTLNAYGNAY